MPKGVLNLYIVFVIKKKWLIRDFGAKLANICNRDWQVGNKLLLFSALSRKPITGFMSVFGYPAKMSEEPKKFRKRLTCPFRVVDI